MLPQELRDRSFESRNGERAWSREDVSAVVDYLSSQDLAVLGGEVWRVHDSCIFAGFLDADGREGIYAWSTSRNPEEPWNEFLRRCAAETISAVAEFPARVQIQPGLPGRILFNLTWVSEGEYEEL